MIANLFVSTFLSLKAHKLRIFNDGRDYYWDYISRNDFCAR